MKNFINFLAFIMFCSSDCSEISKAEKEEFEQKQLVEAGPPGGAAIVKQIDKQLDNNKIIMALNKAKKIIYENNDLVEFIQIIINKLKTNEMALALNRYKTLASEDMQNAKEKIIVEEIGVILNSLSSPLKYLKPDEFVEIKKIFSDGPCISISWTPCATKFFYIVSNEIIVTRRCWEDYKGNNGHWIPNSGYLQNELQTCIYMYDLQQDKFLPIINWVSGSHRLQVSPNGKFLIILTKSISLETKWRDSYVSWYLAVIDTNTLGKISFRSMSAGENIWWIDENTFMLGPQHGYYMLVTLNKNGECLDYERVYASQFKEKINSMTDLKIHLTICKKTRCECKYKFRIDDLNIPKYFNNVNCVDFSPDSKKLISCCLDDQTLRLWDVNLGEELDVINMQDDKPSIVCWSPCGTMLAVGCENSIKIFKRNTL